VLKVKVKVKGHVIRALFWILGMSYSVIDGLVTFSLADALIKTAAASYISTLLSVMFVFIFGARKIFSADETQQ